MSNRRDFLKTLVVGSAGAVALGELMRTSPLSEAFASSLLNPQADGPWEIFYPRILASIKAPTFPKRDFPVTSFGAKADGKTDCTEAFRKATTLYFSDHNAWPPSGGSMHCFAESTVTCFQGA